MGATRREQVEQLFEAALDRPAGERAAWLREACWDDPDLHDEVARLLAAHDRAAGVLELPGGAVAALLHAPPPERVGPYRIVREIGRGGMGSVYLAERQEPFRQTVALKLLRPEVQSDELVRRFVSERQILASLQHPAISRLLDGGVTDDGRPYLVMEHVDGEAIDTWCDRRRLGVEERLRLFCAVARAVQHAHRNLVVHRDLKPSNILVSGDGEVRLLDFGIAKLLDPASVPFTVAQTRTGNVPMTPQYAAPEQVRGCPVTTATDVYGLGLVLYELLCGRRPYEVTGTSPSEAERLICEQEPPRPSSAIVRRTEEEEAAAEEAARARGATPERLRRRLSGDLDRIAMTALRKEPERRYASADALADDVERYLGGHPVRARGDSAGYRARRFVWRNRWSVGVAAVFVVFLAGYAATVTVQARRIERALGQARLEADKSEQVSDFALGLFAAGGPARSAGDSLTVRALLEGAAAQADRLGHQPAAQAQMLDVVGRAWQSLGQYERAEPFLVRALAQRRRALGDRHAATAESTYHLAALRYAQGEYRAAETLYRQALEMQRAVLPAPHPRTARTLAGLALVVEAQGDYPGAERLTREGLQMRRALFGERHPEVAESLDRLAFQLQLQGRRAEAEPIYRQVLETRLRFLGPEHPEVATAMSNLGLLLMQGGREDEALPLYREALAMRRRLLGPEHPDVHTSLGMLGALMRRRGDLAAAESLYHEAIDVGRRGLGADHPDLAHTVNGLGLVLNAKGDYAGADSVFRRVLAVRRRVLGAEHPSVAMTLHQLGAVRLAQGDSTGAERLYLEAISIRRKILGDAHPLVAEAAGSLVALYEAWGREGEAARWRRLAGRSVDQASK